jgi:hypothetical protein
VQVEQLFLYAEITKTMVWNQQQQQNYGDEHTNPLKMNTN